jgi:hypothetical protein
LDLPCYHPLFLYLSPSIASLMLMFTFPCVLPIVVQILCDHVPVSTPRVAVNIALVIGALCSVRGLYSYFSHSQILLALPSLTHSRSARRSWRQHTRFAGDERRGAQAPVSWLVLIKNGLGENTELGVHGVFNHQGRTMEHTSTHPAFTP